MDSGYTGNWETSTTKKLIPRIRPLLGQSLCKRLSTFWGWLQFVVDFGNAGPDRGKGGMFLIVPEDYEGEIPDGYHVARTPTKGNWVVLRGFQVDGSPGSAVEATNKQFKIYPPSRKSSLPEMTFEPSVLKGINRSGLAPVRRRFWRTWPK